MRHIGSLLMSLGFLLSPAFAKAQSGDMLQELAWRTEAGEQRARALYFVRTSDSRFEGVVLLESPTGELAVLREHTDPLTGQDVRKVEFEGSSWWLTLTTTRPVTAPSLREYFRKAIDTEPSERLRVSYRLETSGGSVFTHTTGWGLQSDDELKQLLAELRRAQVDRSLGPQVNAAVLRVAAFLACVDTPASHLPYWRDLGVFLLELAGADPRDPCSGQRWQEERIGPRRGAIVTEPDHLAFVARFRSVENTDPLRDRAVPP